MEIIMIKLLPKWQAALESAVRTFIIFAGPAAYATWEASGHSYGKAAALTALGDGAAAGLAAVVRLLKPLQTDSPGVAVK